MSSDTTPRRPCPMGQLGAAMALILGAALYCAAAVAGERMSDAQKRYQQERAACLSGASSQDRTTCLREAAAAFALAKRGALDDKGAPYARNALQRCERLPDEDRKDCIARMQGQGTTSGSVEGGGIYRELVTRETAQPGPAVPASQPAIAPRK